MASETRGRVYSPSRPAHAVPAWDDRPMSEQHADHGRQDTDVEEPIEKAHHEAAQEGEERLHRSWPVLLATGFLGGVEITIGLLAYLLTLHETDSHLLAGLAFSIGFVALFLAHSELFTEGFYYPIKAVTTGRGTVLELVRLWSMTLLTNLVGGWVTIGLVTVAFPKLHETMATSARHFLDIGFSWQGAALAVLAGTAITLMTRMQAGTDSDGATIAASVAGAVVLAGGSLFHSVMDSILMFGAIQSGAEGITYLDWLGWVWWVIPLNMLGGLLLITAPRVVRSIEADDDGGDEPR